MDLALLLPPLLGQLTALYLFLSPLREVKSQRVKGALTIDSIPFCATLVNNLLWIVLAGLLEDLWIFFPNFVGVFATVFYTTSALRFSSDAAKSNTMEWLLSCGLGFSVLVLMFGMTPILVQSADVRKQICGNICMVISVAMYGSPSFEAIQAIRSKDASKLSLQLAIAGVFNGALWGTYGLATGVFAVMLPNTLGAGLSIFNLLIKLSFSTKPSNSDNGQQDHSKLSNLHLQTLQEEREVLIHSVPHDLQLYVPPASEVTEELEAGLHGIQVRAAAAGIAVHMVRMPGGCLAFRLADGRFLQVWSCIMVHDAGVSSGEVSHQPAAFSIVAMHCDAPGECGIFLPVPAGGMALHHSETRMHDYGEYTVSFWNPFYKVFLRVNEHGDFDCSPPMNPDEAGVPRVPKGWHWERFEVHAADAKEPSKEMLGKNWKVSGAESTTPSAY